MDVTEEMVDIGTNDGPMATALFHPTGDGRYPALIVIQEAFGLTSHIINVARRLAGEGYVTAAPDLFHRAGRLQTAPYDRLAEFRDALRKGFSDDSIIMDVDATVRHLKADSRVDGPVGIVGFCMGGRVSYLAAAYVPGIAAAAIYYGGNLIPAENAPAGTPSAVDMASKISIPLVGFFGEEDGNPSPVHVAKIADALSRYEVKHTFHSYPRAGHGFFCEERASYRPDAAVDAWSKTLAFFSKHLKVGAPS